METKRRSTAECGTVGGYSKHHKLHEFPCQPCKDARNAYRSGYYKQHPEKKRAMDKRYVESHREKVAGYSAKYRENNLEKSRAATLKWNKENPDRMNAAARRRRARKLNNGLEYYTETQVLETYGSVCYLCNSPINLQAPRTQGRGEGWELGLHIDHVVPIVSGGSDTLQNVRPTHALCNLSKNSRPIERLKMSDDTTTPAVDETAVETPVDAPVEDTAAAADVTADETLDESLFDDEDLDDEDDEDLDEDFDLDDEDEEDAE